MRPLEPLELEILNLTRDKAMDLESILVELGIRDPSWCSFWYSAIDCITDLRNLGLIKYQNKAGLEIADNSHAWVRDEMDNLFGKSALKRVFSIIAGNQPALALSRWSVFTVSVRSGRCESRSMSRAMRLCMCSRVRTR